MSTGGYWLVTGVSGYIGGAVLGPLAERHAVLGMTRRRTTAHVPVVQGDFASFEDLRGLDGYELAGLVHLGAATGNGSEEECLAVNVQGTRRLLRYLIDRGVKKFVLASSVAAAGCLNAEFLPMQLPIDDEHPCLARDAYGMSKAMMEELTRYLHRRHPETDFMNLRFGVVMPRENLPARFTAGSQLDAPMVELARVRLETVLRAIVAAVERPHQPGVRTCNVVESRAWCDDPVGDVLRSFYGESMNGLDLSHYAQPGREFDALYAIEKAERELGLGRDG